MAKVTLVNSRNKDGITFMSSEAKKTVDDLEIKGLCMARFKADIETSEVDYGQLSKGDHISLGEMTVLITRVGKGCHATECVVFDLEVPCIMMKEVLFGEVLTDGQVSVGDEVVIRKG